jgi:hypothetical protein
MTMNADRVLALMVLAIGIGVSIYATLVPMVSIGYRWRVDILLAALSPYVVIIMTAWQVHNGPWLYLGSLLIASELWLMGRVTLQPETLPTDGWWYIWSTSTSCLLLLAGALVALVRHHAERVTADGQCPVPAEPS